MVYYNVIPYTAFTLMRLEGEIRANPGMLNNPNMIVSYSVLTPKEYQHQIQGIIVSQAG